MSTAPAAADGGAAAGNALLLLHHSSDAHAAAVLAALTADAGFDNTQAAAIDADAAVLVLSSIFLDDQACLLQCQTLATSIRLRASSGSPIRFVIVLLEPRGEIEDHPAASDLGLDFAGQGTPVIELPFGLQSLDRVSAAMLVSALRGDRQGYEQQRRRLAHAKAAMSWASFLLTPLFAIIGVYSTVLPAAPGWSSEDSYALGLAEGCGGIAFRVVRYDERYRAEETHCVLDAVPSLTLCDSQAVDARGNTVAVCTDYGALAAGSGSSAWYAQPLATDAMVPPAARAQAWADMYTATILALAAAALAFAALSLPAYASHYNKLTRTEPIAVLGHRYGRLLWLLGLPFLLACLVSACVGVSSYYSRVWDALLSYPSLYYMRNATEAARASDPGRPGDVEIEVQPAPDTIAYWVCLASAALSLLAWAGAWYWGREHYFSREPAKAYVTKLLQAHPGVEQQVRDRMRGEAWRQQQGAGSDGNEEGAGAGFGMASASSASAAESNVQPWPASPFSLPSARSKQRGKSKSKRKRTPRQRRVRVFLSHHLDQRGLAQALSTALNGYGLDVRLVDNSSGTSVSGDGGGADAYSPGEELFKETAAMLRACDVFVACLSGSYFTSTACMREYACGAKEGMPFLFLHLEPGLQDRFARGQLQVEWSGRPIQDFLQHGPHYSLQQAAVAAMVQVVSSSLSATAGAVAHPAAAAGPPPSVPAGAVRLPVLAEVIHRIGALLEPRAQAAPALPDREVMLSTVLLDCCGMPQGQGQALGQGLAEVTTTASTAAAAVRAIERLLLASGVVVHHMDGQHAGQSSQQQASPTNPSTPSAHGSGYKHAITAADVVILIVNKGSFSSGGEAGGLGLWDPMLDVRRQYSSAVPDWGGPATAGSSSSSAGPGGSGAVAWPAVAFALAQRKRVVVLRLDDGRSSSSNSSSRDDGIGADGSGRRRAVSEGDKARAVGAEGSSHARPSGSTTVLWPLPYSPGPIGQSPSRVPLPCIKVRLGQPAPTPVPAPVPGMGAGTGMGAGAAPPAAARSVGGGDGLSIAGSLGVGGGAASQAPVLSPLPPDLGEALLAHLRHTRTSTHPGSFFRFGEVVVKERGRRWCRPGLAWRVNTMLCLSQVFVLCMVALIFVGVQLAQAAVWDGCPEWVVDNSSSTAGTSLGGCSWPTEEFLNETSNRYQRRLLTLEEIDYAREGIRNGVGLGIAAAVLAGLAACVGTCSVAPTSDGGSPSLLRCALRHATALYSTAAVGSWVVVGAFAVVAAGDAALGSTLMPEGTGPYCVLMACAAAVLYLVQGYLGMGRIYCTCCRRRGMQDGKAMSVLEQLLDNTETAVGLGMAVRGG